jgi:hypothetical protein
VREWLLYNDFEGVGRNSGLFDRAFEGRGVVWMEWWREVTQGLEGGGRGTREIELEVGEGPMEMVWIEKATYR